VEPVQSDELIFPAFIPEKETILKDGRFLSSMKPRAQHLMLAWDKNEVVMTATLILLCTRIDGRHFTGEEINNMEMERSSEIVAVMFS
jgi:hypothetical protein